MGYYCCYDILCSTRAAYISNEYPDHAVNALDDELLKNFSPMPIFSKLLSLVISFIRSSIPLPASCSSTCEHADSFSSLDSEQWYFIQVYLILNLQYLPYANSPTSAESCTRKERKNTTANRSSTRIPQTPSRLRVIQYYADGPFLFPDQFSEPHLLLFCFVPSSTLVRRCRPFYLVSIRSLGGGEVCGQMFFPSSYACLSAWNPNTHSAGEMSASRLI